MPLMWVSNRPQRRCEQVAGLELEVDPVAARQRVDQVGQQLGRDGRRAIGLDLARDPVGDPDLEVRGGQLEPGVLRLEQDVGQDRQGAPVGHGATDDRQAARQVLLHDREFHVGLHSTLRVGGSNGRGRRWDGRGTRCRRPGPRGCPEGRGYLPSIFSSRHHRSHGVEPVDGHARARSIGPVDGRRGRGGRASGPCGPAWGRAVDDPVAPPAGRPRRAGPSTQRSRTWPPERRDVHNRHPVFHRNSRGYPQTGSPGRRLARPRSAPRPAVEDPVSRRRSAPGPRRSRGAARR